MTEYLTPANITFGIGIIGIIFTIFQYFNKPQIQADKRDALFEQKLKSLIDANEMRFNTMQKNFEGLLLQSNNHIHTVDTKVEGLSSSINGMGKDIVRLATIIDERIPKK